MIHADMPAVCCPSNQLPLPSPIAISFSRLVVFLPGVQVHRCFARLRCVSLVQRCWLCDFGRNGEWLPTPEDTCDKVPSHSRRGLTAYACFNHGYVAHNFSRLNIWKCSFSATAAWFYSMWTWYWEQISVYARRRASYMFRLDNPFAGIVRYGRYLASNHSHYSERVKQQTRSV